MAPEKKRWVQKILLIEDNQMARQLMEKYFQKTQQNKHLKSRLLQAEDGSQGFEMILEHQPDIILCDINMPVMNGFELLEKYNKEYVGANPWGAFCFFSSSTDDRAKAFEKGAMGFLLKEELNYFSFTMQMKTLLRLVFLERTLEIRREIQIL